MTATANHIRSLFVVLVRNHRRLLVILTAWAVMALTVSVFSPSGGSYAAGVELGAVLVLSFWGGIVTMSFVRDVLRQAVSR